MDAVTATFLGIGALALLLLLLSLVGGHIGVGHLHVGHVHIGDGGGQLTLPAIAGFLGAFGFGGAAAVSVGGVSGATGLLLGVVAGLALGLPTAWLARKIMHAAVHMATDATLESHDLLGASGVVVTPVPEDGFGEVRLTVAGHQMKLNARADQPLGLGTRVFVVEVPTPTSVLVEPLTSPKEGR